MNPLSKLIWRWLGRSKLDHSSGAVRYTAVHKIGEVANLSDIELLYDLLDDPNQVIRNAAAKAIKNIIEKHEDNESWLLQAQNTIQERFEASDSLIEQLALIETMEVLPLHFRELVLGDLVPQKEHDLQYAIIKSLAQTQNTTILDDVLDASDTVDLVLRRIALQTWYSGIAGQELDEIQDYATPRLHYLIRATYELQTDGEFLRKVLAFAVEGELPSPKAYPDFMIRYITELLNRWEYDPEAFRSLHAIMVPSYFTFDTQSVDERPYIVL